MNRQALTTYAPRNPAGSMQTTVRSLGWLSIGLGVLGLVAPRGLSRELRVAGQVGMSAGFGVREMVSGIGILTSEDPSPWVWSRVAGDAVDIAALSIGLITGKARKGPALLALTAVGGIAMIDVFCAQWLIDFQTRRARPVPDYSNRSGFPASPEAMRGKAGSAAAKREAPVTMTAASTAG